MATHEPPNMENLREMALELIKGQNTMTLATTCDNTAWAAPVYYANREFRFYFFSDPTSRHIRETLKTNQAAAAIFSLAATWREIRGIQMSGTVSQVSPGLEALQVIRIYLQKFSFTREFFDSPQELDLTAFITRFRVRLYLFRPLLLYYLNNQIRFGFREEIPL